MLPKKNELHELTVYDLNNLGYGVARLGGQVVFVHGAVDGDRVRARIIRVTKDYLVAKTEEILQPSPHRIENGCKSAGCGGCVYRRISYAHECEIKREAVVTAFRKAGLPEVRVSPTLTAGITEGYRNKAQYPVSPSGAIGFFAPKSHRVVEARHCPLAPKIFGEILDCISRWMERFGVSAYREETGEGLVRHLYLRASQGEREILVTVVANGKQLPHEDALVFALTEGFPQIVGILVNVNTENTNVICGDEYRTLWGKEYLTDSLLGVRLRLHPAAFYQVNRAATELLYARAAALADLRGDETLLDLFCGVGSIGLSMAGSVRELIGIEIVESAVLCARENARENGIENAYFYTGDAADTERLLDCAERELGREIKADAVILDPPRKGADERLLRFLAAREIPKIVYISCNPATLARDCATLTSLGYTLSEVTPVDLFPRTGHVESVVCLKRHFQQ